MRKNLIRLWLTVRHRTLGLQPHRLTIEHVNGVPFIILPEVFNPVVFRTGEFLARTLEATPLLNLDNHQIPYVLDLGSGSGIGAIFAARSGARVVAVDINPEAIRCVKINAILNRVDDRIEPRLGDLFLPIGDECFDLILFNPPFYRGKPKDNFDLAWRAENVFERFTASLSDHLTPGGRVLLVLSTDGDGQSLLNELESSGFIVRPIAHRDFGNEVITVYQVSRAKMLSESNDYSL